MAVVCNLNPEWLRGVTKLSELPRYNHWTKAATTVFSLADLGHAEMSERIHWIVENLSGEWALKGERDQERYLMLDNTDAVYYRLAFSA